MKPKYKCVYVKGPPQKAPQTVGCAIDDIPVIIEIPGLFHNICCDCGLQHVIIVEKAGKNKIRLSFQRESSGTAWHRYKEKIVVYKKKKK